MQLLMIAIAAGLLGGPATGIPYDDAAWPEVAFWPAYPDSLASMETTHVVIVQVSIDVGGRVIDASITKSQASVTLNSAALAAARKWRFVPAVEDDVPIESLYYIPFSFGTSDGQGDVDSVRVWEPLPGSAIDRAAGELESHVGIEFLAAHFCLNARRSGRQMPSTRKAYSAFFRFHDSDRPWADMDVLVPLESHGGLGADGIRFPKCRDDLQECYFNISREMAGAIAKDAGLAEGIEPWELRLYWHNGFRDIVWSVQSTEYLTPYRSGESVLIDASSGEVLKSGGWSILH